jgi:hypothetical protein
MSLVEFLPRTDAVGDHRLRATASAGPVRLRAGILTALAVLLPLALLARPLLARQVYTYDDLGAFHLPVRAFYAECLAQGDDFLWCPRLFGGFYLHGEGQAGMYHPLHLLLYSVLPLDVAFNLELLLHYPVLLLGTFFLLRRCGFPGEAALFGAVVFTFSGFNLLHFPHPNALSIIAQLPWQLLALHVALCDPRPRRVALARAALSLLTASQLLMGYPQYVWLCWLLEGLWVVYLLRPWPGLGRLLGLGLAKGVGVLIGGIQLLPTWDCLNHSVRQAPTWDFLAKGSLMPANLVQLVAPYLFKSRVVSSMPGFHCNTHEHTLYSGALVLILAGWAVVRLRHLGSQRRLALAVLGMGVVALVLAFGSYTPLFHLSIRLPVVNLFRYPSRYLLFVYGALAVLAAIAYTDLSRRGDPGEGSRQRRLWPLALAPLASLLVVGLARTYALVRPDSLLARGLADTPHALLGVLLTAAAATLVGAAVRGRRWAVPAMLLFTAADQAAYGLSYIDYDGSRTIDSFLAQAPVPLAAPHRLVGDEEDHRNTPLMQQQSLLNGYAGLPPRRQLDLEKESCLRVAGALFRQKGEHWQRLAQPLPRVRLVTRVVESLQPQEDLDRVDLETTALVDPGMLSIGIEGAGGACGEAVLAGDRPGKIRVTTDAPSRQLLVLAESYHEGWQATADGQSCPVVRVNGDFLGCVVEPGHHEVAFDFRPASLRAGAWLSALGVGLMLAWLGVSVIGWRPIKVG